jgi:hypothetical protein
MKKSRDTGTYKQSPAEGRRNGFLLISCTHISLYIILIYTIILHIDKQSVNKNNPEGRFGEIYPKTAETEFIWLEATSKNWEYPFRK